MDPEIFRRYWGWQNLTHQQIRQGSVPNRIQVNILSTLYKFRGSGPVPHRDLPEPAPVIVKMYPWDCYGIAYREL